MSRRNQKPVDYASFDSPDYSDDEDFIEIKKTTADKAGKERAEKRRSADELSEPKKKQKKAKTTPPKTTPPKKEKQAAIAKKQAAVIQLHDSDDSDDGKSETKFSERKPLIEPISAATALSPIQPVLHTDDGAKESSAFVSATKVLEDDASRRSDSDGENGDTKNTPKAKSFTKSTAEQKSSASFKILPQLSDRLKSLSKWTPPGPVGSSRSSNVMTTPNSGLRMGLSRNNKPKPLHQTPKLS